MRCIVALVSLSIVAWGLFTLPVIASASDFEREIAPLLARRCLSCHTADDPKGSLNLTERASILIGGDSGPAIVPGPVEDSLLWQRVASGDMPPDHPLPVPERELLKSWLKAGANWGTGPIDPLKYTSDARAGYDWWSLQPLQRPPVPSLSSSDATNPIDRFVETTRRVHGLTGSAEAPRAVLIRRLTFDLTGLPPTPEDVAAFENDPSPAAYEQLVDRLLASPHYGERWGRHWLDVVRFGESNGFERDLPRESAWHYRDWVIQALNADVPYDEFVHLQLAADVFAPENDRSQHALGFLVAGPHDTVIPASVRMRQTMRQDEMEDLIGVVSQTFLGLTANCARCHDHKFDPISAKDYYQLTAVFSGVDHVERTVTPPAAAHQLEEWKNRITELEQSLKSQVLAVLPRLMEGRPSEKKTTLPVVLPAPIAAWDFTTGLQDQLGTMHGTAVGNVKLSPAGIELDGTCYVSTAPLTQTLTAKTLEVRVKLSTLDQQGGGAMSVQTLDGGVFDAIAFGEQQPRQWLAGSNFFARTSSFEGPAEDRADSEFVTITITYQPNGRMTAYRNGQAYGRGYASSGPQTFASHETQLLFGLRHGSAGGNRLLRGVIASARLYDVALTDAEVAASASQTGPLITETDVMAQLSADEQARRHEWQASLAVLKQQHAELARTAPYPIYTAGMNQPSVTHLLRRGNVANEGPVVSPAGLSSIPGHSGEWNLKPDAIEYQRRAALATWITDRQNPLFARVIANRLWHYHFGNGLVLTPNDLGFNGGQPSHPELLEWLAAEMVENGYSLKHFHRLLVTSATYRQSSTSRPEAVAIDADNRWLWRMAPRRLDAESLRDALLVAADELNDSLGGKSYRDFNSYFFKGTQFYDPLDAVDYSGQRRTVYRMWARGGRSPFLDTFDCPDPSTPSPRRSVTTTPLQALSLLNNTFSRDMAQRMASIVIRQHPDSQKEQIQAVYQRLFARAPHADEVQLIRDFSERHGLAVACLALINSSEFLYLE